MRIFHTHITLILSHKILMLSLPPALWGKQGVSQKKETRQEQVQQFLAAKQLQLKSLLNGAIISETYTISPRDKGLNWNYHQQRGMCNKLYLSGVTPTMTPTDVKVVKSQILHAFARKQDFAFFYLLPVQPHVTPNRSLSANGFINIQT